MCLLCPSPVFNPGKKQNKQNQKTTTKKPYKTDMVVFACPLRTVAVETKVSEVQDITASLRPAWDTYDPTGNKKKEMKTNKQTNKAIPDKDVNLWISDWC